MSTRSMMRYPLSKSPSGCNSIKMCADYKRLTFLTFDFLVTVNMLYIYFSRCAVTLFFFLFFVLTKNGVMINFLHTLDLTQVFVLQRDVFKIGLNQCTHHVSSSLLLLTRTFNFYKELSYQHIFP